MWKMRYTHIKKSIDIHIWFTGRESQCSVLITDYFEFEYIFAIFTTLVS